MKFTLIPILLSLSLGPSAFCEEGYAEKAESKMEKIEEKSKELATDAKVGAKKLGRKAKRTAKKTMHRIEEATCMKGDLKCAAEKAGNRIEEGKDATIDATKDAVDTISK